MQEKFSENVRARLRSARKESGITLEKLADGTGFALSTFSSAENGHYTPSARLLDVWIQRLHLNKQWVLEGKGSKEEKPLSFFVLPPNDIERAKERAVALREEAVFLIQQAEKAEEIIRDSEAIHKNAGGDATEKVALVEHPDGTCSFKEISRNSQ